jgi:iron complex transport system permease protein
VIRLGKTAFRTSSRVTGLLLAGLALGLILAAWGITLGSFPLSAAEILRALAGRGGPDSDFIVLGLRLPRVLGALLIGPLLACSGALFQGLVRNPLVSPDVVGVNAGASLAAVYWIVTGRPLEWLPLAAFGGALAAAGALYLLSWRGRLSASRLVLVGIGINAMLTAGVTLMIVRAGINEVSRAYQWMTGSLYSLDWPEVRLLAVAAAGLIPLGWGLTWSLRPMQTGDLTARSLGLPLERTRLGLLCVGCALNAVAVSVAGPLGFVALMAPHLARMLAGPMTGGVYALTAVLGGLLVLGADQIGQHALPVALPVGVITAALGAPFFLYLLYRSQARG